MNCSIASALDIVGEPWTLLIVRDAFYGVRRFDDFQENLGIARNVLTARLKKLVEAGKLQLHGAYFGVADGVLMVRDPETKEFRRLVKGEEAF